MDEKTLAAHLDLANHHPDATPEAIERLGQAVKRHGFNAAFVNSCYLALAQKAVGEKGKVGTVIAFPIGQDSRDVKVVGAISAAKKGADELDISMNVGWFKAGKTKRVLEEMKAVVEAAKSVKKKTVVKFIIETGFLTDAQIKEASQLVVQSGADFIKTCSGWGPRGAKLKDVSLIRQAVGKQVKVKVAGGIHDYDRALAFISKGADRIGTSRAIEIIKGVEK